MLLYTSHGATDKLEMSPVDSEQKWKSMAHRNTHNISGFGYICGYSVTGIKPYDLFHF